MTHRGWLPVGGRFGWIAVLLLAATSTAAAQGGGRPATSASERDPLARARLLYNDGQYEAAVGAAEQARLTPARADSADLIAARAYLERFRASSASDDLTNARDRLRRLDPQRLTPRERVEFIVGLGEALYLDGSFGAAAAAFESVLLQGDAGLPLPARERVLDWWATALDREARSHPDPQRGATYQRILDRMRDELAAHLTSATAGYWLAAAAQGHGDADGAWDAAQAGWVRAVLAPDRGARLRSDLDSLVLTAILPDRAKALSRAPDVLRAEWELFKAKWTN